MLDNVKTTKAIALEADIRDMPRDACDQAWMELKDEVNRLDPPERLLLLNVMVDELMLQRVGA